ncbi:hypothetical protein BZL54_21405 [Burkholderia ubonensis subsp. mesacidophila]|uniref:DNA-binding protein n=1 Tax=Burkholderia ubonensis subsp. mesacidophila TaxID=265293 RepID=A0A2A4FD38_9BURK|nr:hypothetical protein BZL54_21405 [Burkholderia ubonensis subsp. mesacidophila]
MTRSSSRKNPSVENDDAPQDRLTAIAQHDDLRRVDTPPVVLGRFYREQLDRRLWPSQAQLAADLGVSRAIVTRSIQASQLPSEVIAAFGGPDRVSFRAAEIVTRLVRELGSEVVARRALTVPAGTAPGNVRSILCSGVFRAEDGLALRLSPGASGRHIRIDSPHIQRVLPHLSVLEDLVNALLPSLLSRCS